MEHSIKLIAHSVAENILCSGADNDLRSTMLPTAVGNGKGTDQFMVAEYIVILNAFEVKLRTSTLREKKSGREPRQGEKLSHGCGARHTVLMLRRHLKALLMLGY